MTLRETLNELERSYRIPVAQGLHLTRRLGIMTGMDEALTAQDCLQILEKVNSLRTEASRPGPQPHKAEPAPEKPAPEKSAPRPASPEAEKLREAADRQLEKLVQTRKIFLDISSILSPYFETFFPRLLPLMQRYHRQLHLPESVLRKLIQIQDDHTNPQRSEHSARRLQMLMKVMEYGLLDVRKSVQEYGQPAQDLLTMCGKFRLSEQLLVLTQDEHLAQDLLQLNRQKSAAGNAIVVKRINRYGFLSNVITSASGTAGNTADKNLIRLETRPRGRPDCPLPVTSLPGKGSTVYAQVYNRTGSIRLEEPISSGGEGTVYRTKTPYVAKIYTEKTCTAYRKEKLELMMKADLKHPNICFPVALLSNDRGEFVGYLMPMAKGDTIKSMLMTTRAIKKKLPDWKKVDLVQCCISILELFRFLHSHNILMGDINPKNIMMASPTEVYLIDTDSYQINDLPCPVGWPAYTPPEIHQMRLDGKMKEYDEFLRTKSNEYFSIAVLLFTILMPGKLPYSQTGGENIVQNILEMHLPYPLGERSGENVPDGAWRFIWSQLTYAMKDKFHQVLNAKPEKSRFNIQERLTVDQWLAELKRYRSVLQKWQEDLDAFCREHHCTPEDIDSNRVTGCEVDPQALVIFPTRLKRQRDLTYGNCLVCNREFPVSAIRFGMCPECRRNRNEVLEEYTRNCKTPGCTNKVTITRGQLADIRLNHGRMPEYCPQCEVRRVQSTPERIEIRRPAPERRRPDTARSDFTYNDFTRRNTTDRNPYTPDKKSSGKAGCCITTAVCDYLGKPDDCEELNLMRRYRDLWLVQQPGGRRLVEQYYACAPGLVRRLKASPRYREICDILWQDYLLPCCRMIRSRQYEQCRDRYVAMVGRLRRELDLEGGTANAV